jgi:hypothetical protein
MRIQIKEKFIILRKISVPVTMSHVINGLRGSIDGAGDSRISSGSSGKIFEVWSGFVLVALETVVQGAVRVVERGVPDPGPDAGSETGLASFLKINKTKGFHRRVG